MAKTVKVEVDFDAQQATIQVKKLFERVTKSKALNKEIGADVVKTVKAAARLKKPLNDTKSFPDLADATIKARRYLERFNKTGNNYGSGKSNVTLTGQFLESLKFSLGSKNEVFIFFDGERSPYKTGPNSVQKNPPNNGELANFLATIGFVVFTRKGINKDKKLMKRINSKVKKYLRRALQVANKINQ